MCKLTNIFIGIVVTLNVSAYCLNQNPMANGEYPYVGSCAVDKINGVLVPFGTKIILSDRTTLVVKDRICGGQYNNRLDRWIENEDKCWEFGRKILRCEVELP